MQREIGVLPSYDDEDDDLLGSGGMGGGTLDFARCFVIPETQDWISHAESRSFFELSLVFWPR